MHSKTNRLFSARNLYALGRGRIPGQVIVQMTDQCNAQCPQCEMRVSHRFERSTLNKTNIERILENAARRGVAAVSFTGGEPFLHFDLLVEMIQRAGDLGIPLIRTGTSGYFLRNHGKKGFRESVEQIAETLAKTPLRNFWFSIDSADRSVHDKIRGFPGVFDGIAKALPTFHEYGIWPTANLGVNRLLAGTPLRLSENPSQDQRDEFYVNCVNAFARFYRTVIDSGFTIVNFCYPMSIESQENHLDSVYRASSADDMVNFRVEEKALLFKAMSEAVAKYRDRIRIFTPRNMLHSLAHRYRTGTDHGYSCRGGKDFFFISAADGDTYPCGFRANENLGKYWSLNRKFPDSDDACTACDWECFRDPSNTLGPFYELNHSPADLARRLFGDPAWTYLWWQDLKYQRAADFCNGRLPPDYTRLAGFSDRSEASFKRNSVAWKPALWQKISGKDLKKLLTMNN